MTRELKGVLLICLLEDEEDFEILTYSWNCIVCMKWTEQVQW
jgi:hypothetical protein